MSDRFQPLDRLMSEDGRGIEIQWGDGHLSVYPFRYLRGYCPCASCQGHGGGPRRWTDPADVDLKGVRLVGNYGINPSWSDGHDSGIFADRYMRSICPCPDCLDISEYGAPLRPLSEPGADDG